MFFFQRRGLAAYAAACQKEERFAADLLLKIDVHDELDGAWQMRRWGGQFFMESYGQMVEGTFFFLDSYFETSFEVCGYF